jgi:hypothetical protein
MVNCARANARCAMPAPQRLGRGTSCGAAGFSGRASGNAAQDDSLARAPAPATLRCMAREDAAMPERSTPPFRADQVGSLLRPPELREARAAAKQRPIDAVALREVEDRCIRDAVAKQEAAGLPRLTDCATAPRGLAVTVHTCVCRVGGPVPEPAVRVLEHAPWQCAHRGGSVAQARADRRRGARGLGPRREGARLTP